MIRSIKMLFLFLHEPNKTWVFRCCRTVTEIGNKNGPIILLQCHWCNLAFSNLGQQIFNSWHQKQSADVSSCLMLPASLHFILIFSCFSSRFYASTPPPRYWVHLLLFKIQPLSEERSTELVEYLISAAVQQVCLSPVDSLALQTLSASV